MATTEDIRGHYVKVNGTRTFYDEIGDGYPIVCVHTAGACSLEYTYILPLLAERGFHAYALDLPGHSALIRSTGSLIVRSTSTPNSLTPS